METLEVDCGGRIACVEVVGHGPDVVYVGTAAPMAWTRPSATILAEHGFRVINFDYGSGHSDPEPRSALRQAEDVVSVMDSLGIGRAALIGLSRGAMTAYGVAGDQTNRVASMVLAFPVAGFADTMMMMDSPGEPSEGESEESFMLGTIFSAEYLKSNLAEATALITTPPGSVSRVGRDDESFFPDDLHVRCRTLIVEGGADQVVSAAHPARYLSAIRQAEHVIVPNAPHAWLMERPDAFAQIVAEFLN